MSNDWDKFNESIKRAKESIKKLDERVKADKAARLNRDMAELARRDANVIAFKKENENVSEFSKEEIDRFALNRKRTKNILKAIKKVEGIDATVIDFKTREQLN